MSKSNLYQGVLHTAANVASNEGHDLMDRLDIGSAIRRALNRFKELMIDKIEILGLPRLEPLDINHIDIDIKQDTAEFKGTMDNIRIYHLSHFDIKEVIVTGVLLWNVDLHLLFDKLEIYGDYDVNSTFDLFHIYGKGPFHVSLYNVDTKVSLKKLRLEEKSFQFDDVRVKVKLEKMECNFTNLMGGGDSGKLFNKVIGDLAPEALDTLWPEIEPLVAAEIKKIIKFSLVPNKIRRFAHGLQINLSPLTSLFGFNARFNIN